MDQIGTTHHGYSVFALSPSESSPMQNHLGGEVAVDDEHKAMYAHGVFVVLYGTDSIMTACNSYPDK